MDYWKHVQTAAGLGWRYPWVLLGGVAAAVALGTALRDARRRMHAASALLVLSFVAFLACGLLADRGMGDTIAYRWLHFAGQLLLAIGIVNVVATFILGVLLAPARVHPPIILRDTLLGVAYVVLTFTLLARHGVDLSGIVATSAVVTAVIGFSLQDTLGNVMGGVALQMERSIGVGDWVRVGEIEGVVREIRWRQTSLETRNWDTVVIPNSVLMKSQVTVLGRRHGREGLPPLHRMWVYFNVDFRHAPAEVIDAVERALQAEPIPNVAADPPPNCILREFKESYGEYAVRYWLVDFSRDDPTSSEIRCRVFAALQREGMRLSIPAQGVFLTMEGKARKQLKAREEVDRRAEALRSVVLFRSLTDAERHELAGRVSVAPFQKGEAITRQGNVAHFLYVIAQGDAEVRVCVGAETRTLRQLHAGDVFGEMGMMTGAARSATVVALTDVVCYRVGKDAFTDILQRRPEIAQDISHLLAARKVELDAAKEELTEEAMKHRLAHTQGDMLDRIKAFFHLG